jgi:tetratricopeptide (TPR) repeat protein
MEKQSPIQKKLFKILEKEEFDRLNDYHDPASWGKWDSNDRFSLALVFMKNGERLFHTDRENSWKSFEHSMSIVPDSALIRQQIAQFCLVHSDDNDLLVKVIKIIQEAATLEPEWGEPYLQWGMANYRLPGNETDEDALRFSIEKLQTAEKYISDIHNGPNFAAQLYWGFANVWHSLGKVSGEAFEYSLAIDYYRKSIEQGEHGWEFWREFGDACAEIAFLLANTDYILEAIECYQRSLQINKAVGGTWLSLAYVFHYFFDISLEDDHAECALEAYENASKLIEDHDQLWVKWGALLVALGKIRGSYELVEKGIAKFEKAFEINPKHQKLNILWADALLIASGKDESLQQLKLAEEKIIASLKDSVDDARSWYIYGLCLNSFGRYFDDPAFHRKSLDKLNRAVELDPKDPLFWHAIAMSHLELFAYEESHSEIDKSLRAFSHAIEINPKGWPQLWNDWGVALMKLGERTGDKHYIEASLVKFENVMKTSQQAGYEEHDLQPDWLYNYGCALDFLGEYYSDQDYYEKAIHMLTRSLQLDPHFHNARFNLAITLTHLAEIMGDLDLFYKAQEQFLNAISENDEEEFVWNEWGVMCMHAAELVAEECLPEKSREWLSLAEPKLLQAAFLGSSVSYYNLACLYSLTDQLEQSLFYLEKAKSAGSLPPMETLLEDLWLENVRRTAGFRSFLSSLH